MPSPVQAQELERKEILDPEHFQSRTLTGDWNGLRTRLWARGVSVEFEYTGEVFSLLRPDAADRTDYAGKADLELFLNAERLVGWPGARFFVFGFVTHGREFQNLAGSVHDVSNIEAPDSAKLMEAWYEQILWKETLSVLVGLYDVNSEFDVRETASLFLNGVFGIGLDFSEAAVNGPSIFPDTALGVRLNIRPGASFYYQAAVLDGVPGDPGDPQGTGITLDADDGLMVAQEAGWQFSDPQALLRKIALGGWFFTRDFDDPVKVDAAGLPLQHSGTFGLYGFVEGVLYREPGDSRQGLHAFFRAGAAEEDVNPVAFSLDAGLVYRGPIPGRNRDLLGLGISSAFLSDPFQAARRTAGATPHDRELLLELTYRLDLGRGVYLQPDLQIVLEPGLRERAGDTVSLGLRIHLDL